MKVEVTKLDKLKRIIKVEISGDAFVAERKNIYEEIGKSLKVPGFRQGSAPLEIIEKHHLKVLKEEFLHRMLPIYYEKALSENKLTPSGTPRVYDVELSDNSLVFSAEFDVKPEIELKDTDYKGIKVKEKKVEVGLDEIEKVLTNLKDGIKKIMNKDFADDELCKWAGYPNIVSFKDAIKAEILSEKFHERRRNLDSQISQHLLKNIKAIIPQNEVERYHKELVNREIHNLRLRSIPDEDIEKYKKDIEEKLKPLAEDEVKLFYILEAIANKENIKAESNLGEVILGFLLSLAQYE
ncbi:MAG: trigger factor [Candidatus Omnitrophota bacterium]|jgi:FKBP-type peptidyl-prolyl cis-trans isomerase (trigger factor)